MKLTKEQKREARIDKFTNIQTYIRLSSIILVLILASFTTLALAQYIEISTLKAEKNKLIEQNQILKDINKGCYWWQNKEQGDK